MSNYEPIDPRHYTVPEVLEKLNGNLDYLYSQQESSNTLPENAENLIPYTNFSIISNLEYWLPYKESDIHIKDSMLEATNIGNVVGVISPIVTNELIAGSTYTFVIEAKSNTTEALLNELFIQKADDSLIRINCDKSIEKDIAKITTVFKPQENISNFRIVFGSGDVTSKKDITFTYEDKLTDRFFYNKLLLSSVDFNSNKNLIASIPIKNTLEYLLVNFNSEILAYIESISAEGCPTIIYPTKGLQELTTLREQFLLTLLYAQQYTHNPTFETKTKQCLDFLMKLYTESKIAGVFQVITNNDDYSIYLSSIFVDIVDTYRLNHDDYSYTNVASSVTVTLDGIKQEILNFVRDNADKMKGDLLKGAIKYKEDGLTYSFLSSQNMPSSTKVDTTIQLELCRLLVIAGKQDIVKDVLRVLFSSQIDIFTNSYIIPTEINNRTSYTKDAEISIAPTILYYKLLMMNDALIDNQELVMQKILNTIVTFRSDNGLYKVDMTLNNQKYSCNQYAESLLNGVTYSLGRDISFKSIALCLGENVTPEKPNDIWDKVENAINRSEIMIDEDSIIAIVSNEFISKEYLNGQLSSIYSRLESAELQLTKESIIAKVIDTTEWHNLTDTVDNNHTQVMEQITDMGAKVEINTNAITQKIWNTDIQNAISSVVSTGQNIIKNSTFLIGNKKYWVINRPTEVNISTESDGTTWAGVDTATPITFEQVTNGDLYAPKGNVSILTKGNGTITLTVFKGATQVATATAIATVAETRFDHTFDVDEVYKPTLKIAVTGTVKISKIKLCYGSVDLGWSMNTEDIPELNMELKDDFNAMNDYLENAYKDGMLSASEAQTLVHMLLAFEKEKDQYSHIVTSLLQHVAITGTPMATRLSNAYASIIAKFTEVQTFINNVVADPSSYDAVAYKQLVNAYKTLYTTMSNAIQDANNQISHYEAMTESGKVQTTLRAEIKDVDDRMGDLNDYIDGAFKDDVLTIEEKEKIKEKLEGILKEKGDVKEKVDYYNSKAELNDTDEKRNLGLRWSEYDVNITNYSNKVTEIVNASEITQEMRYQLNNLYILYTNASKELEKALLIMANKLSTSVSQSLVDGVQKKLDETNSSLGTLDKYVKGAFKDDLLLQNEKTNIKSQMEGLNRQVLQLMSEVDYFDTLPALVGTKELEDLNKTQALVTQYFEDLKLFTSRLLSQTTITSEDKLTWQNKIDLLMGQLETIQVNLQDCALKANSTLIGADISDIVDNLGDVSSKLDGIYDFTDSAWLDGNISYQEAVGLASIMSELDMLNQSIKKQVNDLLANPKLAGTAEKTDTESKLSEYTIAYNALVTTVAEITADGKVSPAEKNLFNSKMTIMKGKYVALNGSVVALGNKLIQLERNADLGTLQGLLEGQINDVDEALGKIEDLSNDSFAGAINTIAEKEAFKTLKDTLYKEHLDVMKQLDVLMDAKMTPELVGNEILTRLNLIRGQFGVSYNTLDSKIDTIINATISNPANRTAYNTALTAYKSKLNDVRQILMESTKLVSDLKASGNLNEFIQGDFQSIVTRVEDAEFKLTPERITAWVESTSSVIVKQDYLTSNYITKATIESTYSTKAQMNILQNEVNLKATQEEVERSFTQVTGRLDGVDTTIEKIDTRLKDAELKVTTEYIQGVVGTVSYSKTEVDNKLNNIVVGTRNLAILYSNDKTVAPHSPTVVNYETYKMNWSANSNALGLKMYAQLFKADKKYYIAYKFKKTAGTITTIGGHNLHKDLVWYLDGTKVVTTNTGFPVPQDTKEHLVECYFTAVTHPTNDLNVYIQPNRSSAVAQYTIEIKDLIIAESTKQVNWTASPEDAQYFVNQAKIDATLALQKHDELSSDNILSPIEKQIAQKDWEAIKGEKAKWEKEATDLGISTEKTNYTNAYTSLYNYLSPLLASITTNSTIVGATYRNTWKSYYDARQDLANAISSKIQSNVDGIVIGGRNYAKGTATKVVVTGSNTSNQTLQPWTFTNYSLIAGKGVVTRLRIKVTSATASGTIRVQTATASYLQLIGAKTITTGMDTYIEGQVRLDNSANTQISIRFDNFVGTVEITEAKVEVGNKATDWIQAPEDVQQQIDDAKAQADEAMEKHSELSSDSKLTPVEKQSAMKEWVTISAEKTQLNNQAVALGVTTENTSLNTVYNTLNTYLTPLFADMTTTSNIVGATYRKNWRDYYNAKQILLNAFNNKVNSNIDDIQIGYSNLLLNTGFTNGITDWARNSSNIAIAETQYAVTGKCMRVTMNSTATDNVGVYQPLNIPVVKIGQKYTCSGFFKCDSATTKLTVGLEQSGTKSFTQNAGTDGWTPFKVTVTQTHASHKVCVFYFYGASGNMYLKDLKVEEGNKATSWSPAKQDIDREMSEIKDDIDNIVVGSANILDGTNFKGSNLNRYWKLYSNWSFDDQGYRNTGRAFSNSITSGYNDLRQLVHSADNKGKYLESNTEYTLSFWSYGIGKLKTHLYPGMVDVATKGKKDGVEITMVSDGAVDWTMTGTWTYHTLTFTTMVLTNTDKEVYFRVPQSPTAGENQVRLSRVKLEKGNKATEWSPSTTDLLDNVNDIEVGGRNFIRNGNFYKSRDYWTNEGTCQRDIQFDSKGYTWLWLRATDTTTYRGVGQTIRNIKPNQEYTLSFRAKYINEFPTANNVNIGIHYKNAEGTILAQDWNQQVITQDGSIVYTWTIKTPNNATLDNIYLLIEGKRNVSFAINYTDLKLERGNKASDYSMSIEDSVDDMARPTNTTNLLNTIGANPGWNWHGTSFTSNTFADYRWIWRTNSNGNGIRVHRAVLTEGKKYTWSFRFRKTEGTITKIGGHLLHDVYEWYIDGVRQTGNYSGGINYTADTNAHTVSITFKAVNHATNDLNIYFQPNRNGSASQYTIDVDNMIISQSEVATSWNPSPSDVLNNIETAVDNVVVGGTNLLRNSSLKFNNENWTTSILNSTSVIERSQDLITPKGNTPFMLNIKGYTADSWCSAMQLLTNGKVVVGREYTASCWAYVPAGHGLDQPSTMEIVCFKSDNTTRAGIFSGINENGGKSVLQSIIGRWQKLYVTFKVPAETTVMRFAFWAQRNGKIYCGDFKLEEGNKVTAWSSAPEDIDDLVDSSQQSLQDIINKNTESNNLAWTNKLDEALKGYMATGEKDEIIKIINSTVKQTDDSFNIVFNAFKGTITDTTNGLITSTEEMQSYFRFDLAGLVLGRTNSPFTLRLTNERIQFLENGSEVAYLSNNTLVITEAFVKTSLRIGNFKWLPRANGNLSFTWVGGINVTGVTLEPASATCMVGDQLLIKANITPANADNTYMTWMSHDKTKATVTNEGIITALALGTVTITCTVGKEEAQQSCTINITGTRVKSVSIPADNVVNLGSKFAMWVTWNPTTCTNKTGKWEVEDSNIVQINNNNVLQNAWLGVSNSVYQIKNYDIVQAQKPKVGDVYELRFKGTLGTGKTHWGAYNSGGNVNLGLIQPSDKVGDYFVKQFTWTNKGQYPANDTKLTMYAMPSSASATSSISMVSLKKVADKDSTYSNRSDDTDNNTYCYFIAKKAGVTVIKFTSNDGNFISRCIVRVVDTTL